ncbi:MAG: hypothetical protein Alpg2KO_30610 [Alphaproteobacteria bacterium]
MTLVEYAVLVGLVSVIAIATITSVGDNVRSSYNIVSDQLDGLGNSSSLTEVAAAPTPPPNQRIVPAGIDPAFLPTGINPGDTVTCDEESGNFNAGSSSAQCIIVTGAGSASNASSDTLIFFTPSGGSGYEEFTLTGPGTVIAQSTCSTVRDTVVTLEDGASVYIPCATSPYIRGGVEGYDGNPSIHVHNVTEFGGFDINNPYDTQTFVVYYGGGGLGQHDGSRISWGGGSFDFTNWWNTGNEPYSYDNNSWE